MRTLFGAPIAMIAPVVGYLLNWIAVWISQGLPRYATSYWPPNVFCRGLKPIDVFCSGRPGTKEYMIIFSFFICCIVGWESIRLLGADPEGPERAKDKSRTLENISRGLAWSIVLLPTIILLPHVYMTTSGMPGVWGWYGWGTETVLDLSRAWFVGTAFMFLYALTRRE